MNFAGLSITACFRIVAGFAAIVMIIALMVLLLDGHTYISSALTVLGLVTFVLSCAWLVKLTSLQVKHKDKEHLTVAHDHMEKMLLTLIEQSSDGLALVDLNGKLIKCNHTISKLLGENDESIKLKNFFDVIKIIGFRKQKSELKELVNGNINTYRTQKQYTLQDKNIWININISVIRENGLVLYYLFEIQDITLLKKAEESLSHMAYHDPLTGLGNRNKLEQFVQQQMARANRYNKAFALIFVDLDHFKNINDTIGHDAGDDLLKIVAERLNSIIRKTDLVVRLGGDEFVMVITDVKKSESVACIANKILEETIEPVILKGQEVYITASIGISLYPFDGQNLNALMKNADLALYQSKEYGKNNYQFYTLKMTNKAQEKLSLQNAIAHALLKDEFLLNYQPKMDLKTQRITGVEALLRWHSKRFNISPKEIINLSEEMGLIEPVSEWILRAACQSLQKWQKMGFTSLTLAVNCSARQISQPEFAKKIIQIAKEQDITPRCIELEVTEKIIMQDPESIFPNLYAAKDAGVKIVIDDFGSGYWSLNNLRKLSVDQIKIDQTFIKSISSDEISADIVRAIIAMATKLGIKSIAEGVETKEQYQFLMQEGCTEIQGYYLTPPLNYDALTSFLKYPVPDAEITAEDNGEKEDINV